MEVDRTLRGAGKKALSAYHERMSEIFLFSCVLGDWQTATLFCRNVGDSEEDNPLSRMCPANPEPAKPETLAKFMQWKTTKDDEVHMFQDKEICDISGKPLKKCKQQWKTPTNIDLFMAVVSAVHNVYPELQGDYILTCSDCEKDNAENLSLIKEGKPVNQWCSCPAHAGRPLLKPRGNVVKSDLLESKKNELMAELKRIHRRKGNIRLLPGHLKQLHDSLMEKFKSGGREAGVFFLMMWTMIVVGISLFLRAKELLALKLKHFHKKGCMVTADEVVNLAIEVEDGKNDPKPLFFKLWKPLGFFPWFNPVSTVLFYIDIAGLDDEEGFLFPCKTDLLDISLGKKNTQKTRGLCPINNGLRR